MKSKERTIWELATEIINTHGELIDNLHILEVGEMWEEKLRIYHSDGYCIDLERIEADAEDTANVEDGYVYCYNEMWDGFKIAGIDKAIEILSEYASINQ